MKKWVAIGAALCAFSGVAAADSYRERKEEVVEEHPAGLKKEVLKEKMADAGKKGPAPVSTETHSVADVAEPPAPSKSSGPGAQTPPAKPTTPVKKK